MKKKPYFSVNVCSNFDASLELPSDFRPISSGDIIQ